MKQYRFVILGNIRDYYSYFNYGVLEGAIRNGAWAKTIELQNRKSAEIKTEIQFFKPHFIVCHCIFGPIRQDILNMLRGLRKTGIRVIYHMGDARVIPRYTKPITDFVDLALVNNDMRPEFERYWKIPTIHWPYMCLYQKELANYDKRYECNMAFTGGLDNSTHHQQRKKFINGLKTINIKTFPTKETGNTRFQTAELSSTAKSVLGVQMGQNIKGYQDVRPFQYIGAGALYFHDKHPSIDMFFEDKKHYISYKTNDAPDLVNKFNHYYSNEKAAMKIRQDGFDFCQKHHSTKQRVENIIRYFEGKQLLPILKNDILSR